MIAAQVKAPADALAGGDRLQRQRWRAIRSIRGASWNARKANRFPNAIVLAERQRRHRRRENSPSSAAGKSARGPAAAGFRFHTRDNAVLINISKMKDLSVDPKTRIATVSSGRFGDAFDKALAEQYQLMFPSAICPRVGWVASSCPVDTASIRACGDRAARICRP